MQRIYMDANATTPVLPEVMDAMCPYFLERFGNASSIHLQGQQARAAVEQARASVAALLNCRPGEIVFTSGGTEGDNLALFGMLKAGDHLITTAVEHHAVLYAAKSLRERGVEVTFLPVDEQGLVDPAAVRQAVTSSTKLISVMAANNETGTLQPIEEISLIAQEADVYFHTDAVQAAGKIPLDVAALKCDLLTISGHKIHAPQGVGALFVRRGTPLAAAMIGGAQERRRRAGTENVPGIVGLGKAAECAAAALDSGVPRKLAAMRDRLEDEILERVEVAGIHSGRAPRAPNTTNLWFDHVEGEALVIALDLKGLAVSGGAACASGSTEPSHVLLAMRVELERARASVRFSLHNHTTEQEIDRAVELVTAEVGRLLELSPAYRNPMLSGAR